MSARPAAKVVSVIGVIAAAMGVLGVVSPSAIASIASWFNTSAALYAAAAMRLAVGAFLLWIGPACRSDWRWVGLTVRVIGIMAILAAISIIIMAPGQVQGVVDWATKQPALLRASMLLVLVLGAFLIYAGL
jgi:hypothetical protein